MTDLGTIPLTRDAAVREARRKVRQVLQDLTGDDLQSTRIGSGVSALGRAILREGTAPALHLQIDARDGAAALVLIFRDQRPIQIAESVAGVFDTLEAGRAGAHAWEVRARVRLQAGSRIDDRRIAELREIVQPPEPF